MKICRVLFACIAILAASPLLATTQLTERPDWGHYFSQYEATGTIVIDDQRGEGTGVQAFDSQRAQQRFSPASTYKIPHTLFALDSGAVADEFQVFPWDGVKRSFEPHNQDQNLRSAMRNSAVWVYQLFAAAIGEEQAAGYLQRTAYGNAVASAESGDYWIDGDLAISAEEQIHFLQRLFKNQLPFAVEHQRLVKDLIIIEADRDWILRAKTGWEGRYGWWVGWVEWPEGPVFFALNIDTPNRLGDLHKREAVARAVLESIKALPAAETSSHR